MVMKFKTKGQTDIVELGNLMIYKYRFVDLVNKQLTQKKI